MTKKEAEQVQIGDKIKVSNLIVPITGKVIYAQTGSLYFETNYGNFLCDICDIPLTNKKANL